MSIKSKVSELRKLIDDAQVITIVQAENPDADSLGSAVALENILGKLGKNIFTHCAVDIPQYLRYIKGWDRVGKVIPSKTDLIIIVDTGARTLLEKSMLGFNFTSVNTVIIDHHDAETDLDFIALNFNEPEYAAAAQLVFDVATEATWDIPLEAAEGIIYGILGDTLGFNSPDTNASTLRAVADLISTKKISLHELENRRREYGRKSLRILNYKGQLLQRLVYEHNNQIAWATIPLEEIKEYSDQYNPAALILEELRGVEEIRIAIVFKTYGDRITGKLREIRNARICNIVAEKFGGGGHPFAAGFKINRSDIDKLRQEVLTEIRNELEKSDSSDKAA
jgi:bifunctional oligoribonuclease and PAP phosphatase NrnA